jgi:hypothetical protein
MAKAYFHPDAIYWRTSERDDMHIIVALYVALGQDDLLSEERSDVIAMLAAFDQDRPVRPD